LRDAAERQNALITTLLQSMADKVDGLGEAIARAAPAPGQDAAQVSEAMTQLAAAVDRLAEPVLRRIKLLGTTDRRLLLALQHQEHVVSNVGNRWGELVAALQAMSLGLESFARAATQHEHDTHLVLARPGKADPADLSGELQDLIDEMSEDELPAMRQQANRAGS
jgi:hypothetical protein